MDMVAVRARRSSSRSLSTNRDHAFTKAGTVTSSFQVGSMSAPGVGSTSSSAFLALMLPVGATTLCLARRNPAALGTLDGADGACVAGVGVGFGAAGSAGGATSGAAVATGGGGAGAGGTAGATGTSTGAVASTGCGAGGVEGTEGVGAGAATAAAGGTGADGVAVMATPAGAGGINPASGLFFFSASWEQICISANSTRSR